MRSHYDARRREVTLTLAPAEFADTVRWLEELAPFDGATREWREHLDRLIPARDEDDDDDEEVAP